MGKQVQEPAQKDTALVVVDVQRGFVSGRTEHALPQIEIRCARRLPFDNCHPVYQRLFQPGQHYHGVGRNGLPR